MSRTHKAKLVKRADCPRANRGKHSHGIDKRGTACAYCLRNLSKLERERKDFDKKYPKRAKIILAGGEGEKGPEAFST